MTKTLSWVLIAGVLLVGGYYAFNSREKAKEEVVKETSNIVEEMGPLESESSEAPSSGKKMAFSELVKKQDGSYKCTVNQYIGDTTTQGVTYINAGMIRGEFNSKVQSMSVDTTFVVRDGFSYTWSSILPSIGFKAKVDATASTAGATGSASGTYSFNAEQVGDYDCQPWTLDASKFVIPTNITFKEMTS